MRRAIVVGGAHGKTTTTAMIAYALAELGLDPAWLVGGELPQLGGNAGAGEGWLVVEGDESDRTLEQLRPEIGVVTNVDLDHHSTFASEAEVAALFERWLDGVPHAVRGWELEPVAFELAIPGEHNRRNAAAAVGGAGAGGGCSRRRRARVGGLPRRGAPVRARRRARRRDGRRRLRPSSERDRGVAGGGARADGGPRARALPAAPLLPHAASRVRARGGAVRCRRRLRHGDLPRRARSRWRASAASSSSTRCGRACAQAGRRAWRTARGSSRRGRGRATSCSRSVPATSNAPGRSSSRRSREDRGGRRAGAADDDRHRRAGSSVRPAGDARGARAGARLGGGARSRRRDRRARLEPARRGRGRRCARAPACAASSPAARIEGELLVAGGGATNAVCLHQARDAGLGGFEFACAIPGTAGGGVWMNAGAYGSDWAAILVRALVVTAEGAGWLTAAELGLVVPALGAAARAGRGGGRVPARAAAARGDQGDRPRARRAAEGDAADEQAHVRERVQEPRSRARAPAGCSSCAASRDTGSAAP